MIGIRRSVVCLIFGPNPSSEVRAVGRVDRARRAGLRWEIVQLEPYLGGVVPKFVPQSVSHKVRRGLGKLLTPALFALAIPKIARADVVYVIKAPPLWMSRVIGRFAPAPVYDFDDPVWLPSMKGEAWFRATISRYPAFTCDNDFCLRHVAEMDLPSPPRGATLPGELPQIPRSSKPLDRSDTSTNVLWAGSFSTVPYLKGVAGPLRRVVADFPDVKLLLLGPREEQLKDLGIPRERIELLTNYDATDLGQWLERADIGLFPLDDQPLSYLRGNHKARIYNAFGIPTVVSEVPGLEGVVVAGKSGFICRTDDEWFAALTSLVTDGDLRARLSAGASSLADASEQELDRVPEAVVALALSDRTADSPNDSKLNHWGHGSGEVTDGASAAHSGPV